MTFSRLRQKKANILGSFSDTGQCVTLSHSFNLAYAWGWEWRRRGPSPQDRFRVREGRE